MKRLFAALCALCLLLALAGTVLAASGQQTAPGPAAQSAAPSGAAPQMPPQAAPVPAAPAQNTPAQASQPASGMPDINLSWGGYFEALGILFLLLAALWAMLWLVKRRGGLAFTGASAPGLYVESRLALGPKKWLMVVRYNDRRLVLGVTDQTITQLSEIYLPDQPQAPLPGGDAAPAPGSGKETSGLSFASFLKKDKDPTM